MNGIDLQSPAFADGAAIPALYAHDGGNVSPPLHWSGVPEAASELLLLCEDPDAPGASFVHWLVSGIDPAADGVDEGRAPQGGRQWANSFGETGWGGPQPPRGDRPHHYVFHLYALPGPLELPANPTSAQIRRAADDLAIAEGHTTGLYQRPLQGA